MADVSFNSIDLEEIFWLFIQSVHFVQIYNHWNFSALWVLFYFTAEDTSVTLLNLLEMNVFH